MPPLRQRRSCERLPLTRAPRIQVNRVLTGGQDGVERTALRIARRLGMRTGGWAPRWRADEIPDIMRRYGLRIMPNANFVRCTEQNVREADGVLVFSLGPPSGSGAVCMRLARWHQMLRLNINLRETAVPDAGCRLRDWLGRERIRTLAVTGPKSEGGTAVSDMAGAVLEAALRAAFPAAENGRPPAGLSWNDGGESAGLHRISEFNRIPRSVEESVDLLMGMMDFRQRTRLAGSSENLRLRMIMEMEDDIIHDFRLNRGNKALLRSCRELGDAEESPARVILRFLVNRIRKDGLLLRRVK